jgi:serine/threonine protein kinase
MPLAAGTRLGPYEIVSMLGEGGMGEVYRAVDTDLNRAVAIKVLPDRVKGDPNRLARFQREAEILAGLNHPHIAHVHGWLKTDDRVGLVMELVEGPTLAELIDGRSKTESGSSRLRDGASAAGRGAPRGLSLDDALAIAKQIALALETAARPRHRPSRPEARQHQSAPRWSREGPGLWAGEADRFRRKHGRAARADRRPNDHDSAPSDPDGRGARHARVHGA